MADSNISSVNVAHLALLSKVNVTPEESNKLESQFLDTLKVIQKLTDLDTKEIIPTPQVTGLANCFRDDQIDPARQLVQAEALSNAKETYHGYFLVPAIL